MVASGLLFGETETGGDVSTHAETRGSCGGNMYNLNISEVNPRSFTLSPFTALLRVRAFIVEHGF
jgi:hypothetical protein